MTARAISVSLSLSTTIETGLGPSTSYVNHLTCNLIPAKDQLTQPLTLFAVKYLPPKRPSRRDGSRPPINDRPSDLIRPVRQLEPNSLIRIYADRGRYRLTAEMALRRH
ncbi:hypothetical protein GWI33_012004 [Rhynchophorus ferrugineus]|uniref:Uncharacterized protein n=1 Tax=Rhynchophorus ferrugineus TaxID=354439 RepID=A0A834IU52_RHYFE|nr:hypothetical protein GWI33_012004 [Rhynchophorus ferrugineus]